MDRAHDRRSWTRSPLIYTDSNTLSPSCLTRARVRTRPSRAAYFSQANRSLQLITRQYSWHKARALINYVLTLSIRTAWVGVITFQITGFTLELAGLSLRKGGVPDDPVYGLFLGGLGVLLFILPAIALTIIPCTLFLAIALHFAIRHPAIYCVAGLTISLIALPLFSKIGMNHLMTWPQIVAEPGLRLCFSGVVSGLALWRNVKATT